MNRTGTSPSDRNGKCIVQLQRSMMCELSSQKCQDEEHSGLYKMILIASHLWYPET